MSKKLQSSIADNKSKDRLVRLKKARIVTLENEINRLDFLLEKTRSSKPMDFTTGFITGIVVASAFLFLIAILSSR